VTAALVPEVAEARDHVRGSRGPTLLIFGDYECPYTCIACRSVQFLEAEAFPSCSSSATSRSSRFIRTRSPRRRRARRQPRRRVSGRCTISSSAARKRSRKRTSNGTQTKSGWTSSGSGELEAHVHLDRVEADRSSALASGAAGTPTIFVDGLPYHGSFERAELRRALAPNGEESK
jgi:hypothetical protein